MDQDAQPRCWWRLDAGVISVLAQPTGRRRYDRTEARASWRGRSFEGCALGVLDKVARVAVAHLVVFELIAIDDLDGAVEPPDDVEVVSTETMRSRNRPPVSWHEVEGIVVPLRTGPVATKNDTGGRAPAPKPELVFAKHAYSGPVMRGTAPLLGDKLHS